MRPINNGGLSIFKATWHPGGMFADASQFPHHSKSRAVAERLLREADCDVSRANLALVRGVSDLIGDDDQIAEVISAIPSFRLPIRVDPKTLAPGIASIRVALTRFPGHSVTLVGSLLEQSSVDLALAMPEDIQRRCVPRNAALRVLSQREFSQSAQIAAMSDAFEAEDVERALSIEPWGTMGGLVNRRVGEVHDIEAVERALRTASFMGFSELRKMPRLALQPAQIQALWLRDNGTASMSTGSLVVAAKNTPTHLLVDILDRGSRRHDLIAEVMRHPNTPIGRVQHEWRALSANKPNILAELSPYWLRVAAGHPQLDVAIRRALLQGLLSRQVGPWQLATAIKNDDLALAIDPTDFVKLAPDATHADMRLFNNMAAAHMLDASHFHAAAYGSVTARAFLASHPEFKTPMELPATEASRATAQALMRTDREFVLPERVWDWGSLPGVSDVPVALPAAVAQQPTFELGNGVSVRVVRAPGDLKSMGFGTAWDWHFNAGKSDQLGDYLRRIAGNHSETREVIDSMTTDRGHIVAELSKGDERVLAAWEFAGSQFRLYDVERWDGRTEHGVNDPWLENSWVQDVTATIADKWSSEQLRLGRSADTRGELR